jgi:hypothetical protein
VESILANERINVLIVQCLRDQYRIRSSYRLMLICFSGL